MNQAEINKTIHTFFSSMNLDTKEISLIHDNDFNHLVVSLRISGSLEESLYEISTLIHRDIARILSEFLKKQHHYHKDIVVDINNQQIKAINHIKSIAEIAVERVLFFDKTYEFGYLNAYERMLIHSYLKNTKGIETESTGEGRERRLSIKKQS